MPSSRTLQLCDLLEHGGPNLVPFCSGVSMETILHPPLFHSHCLAATFWKERKMADVKIPNEHDSCGLNDPFAINPWKNIYWINRGGDLSQQGCCWTWAGLLIVKSSRHWSHGVLRRVITLTVPTRFPKIQNRNKDGKTLKDVKPNLLVVGAGVLWGALNMRRTIHWMNLHVFYSGLYNCTFTPTWVDSVSAPENRGRAPISRSGREYLMSPMAPFLPRVSNETEY